ncbi:hypothetical protein SNE40_022297 [Patella caerulea]|uniref:Profilin n=1 Tax=Patella caerulea TaxID=87958 RepID=A0AAN8G3N5_PATCE
MAEIKTLLVGLLALCLVNSCFCKDYDSYIYQLIAQSKDSSGNVHVDAASIIGLDRSRLTSQSTAAALKMSYAEVDTIAASFKSNDFTSFKMSGVRVGGIRYDFLRQDGNEVFASKKNYGGIVMMKSKTAIVIAHYPEGRQVSNAAKGVEAITGYLQ